MEFQRFNYIQSGVYTIRYSKNLFQDCFMNIYRSNVLNETEWIDACKRFVFYKAISYLNAINSHAVLTMLMVPALMLFAVKKKEMSFNTLCCYSCTLKNIIILLYKTQIFYMHQLKIRILFNIKSKVI
jgi:hypothetical protein